MEPAGRQRAHLDRHRTRFGAGERAIIAEPHRTRGRIIGDHGDDDVRVLRSLAGRRRNPRAFRDERVRLGARAIPDRDGEALVEPVRRHARAHDAQAEKCNVLH